MVVYFSANILFTMAEKRKRAQNFTVEEKDKLVKLLLGFKETILNKKTDGSTNETKNQAWVALTSAFNSSGSIYRSKESLMKFWDKMKSEGKVYYSKARQSSTQTGGGPCIIKIDPVLEQVCAILGRGCTGIIGVQDCDANENGNENLLPAPNPIFVEEEPQIQFEVVAGTSSTLAFSAEEPKNATECEQISQSVISTPLWSRRRRPQLSHTNERSEAVTSLCASFQEVNKKKESIEELKLQILKTELEYKKQLFDIQLKTAAKELEIKSEVLSQIKGGGLSLQNLFGVPQTKE